MAISIFRVSELDRSLVDFQAASLVTRATRLSCSCVLSPDGYQVATYGAPKLLPFWDPLRGDPRFEKIVASLAPKERH
jgi:hypothetical protein